MPITATFTDWLGKTIEVGDIVVYPAAWHRGGRHKTMVKAQVDKLAMTRNWNGKPMPIMIVLPLAESGQRPAGAERKMHRVRLLALDHVTVVPQ